jgi:hypothetical protein
MRIGKLRERVSFKPSHRPRQCRKLSPFADTYTRRDAVQSPPRQLTAGK